MSPAADEGGDPACWAHLFDDDDAADDSADDDPPDDAAPSDPRP